MLRGTMPRPYLTALLVAWIAIATACVEPGAPETGTAEAHLVEQDCDYITCGSNTHVIGNGRVDQVYFDGTPNARGQQFVSWLGAGGEAITPVLTTRSVAGAVGNLLRVGPALTGSVITLVDGGEQVKLRFVDARYPTLPNGLSIWVYHLEVWRAWLGWRPLCPLFDHTSSDIARYAIPGTREVVHVDTRTITLHTPAEGKLTLGCPSSATGKMLSLGALATTAIDAEASNLPEMRATLLALTLSPLGGTSYTEAGVPVIFHVVRTGLDNSGATISGGLEGLWGSNGAICFEGLRGTSSALKWALWSDTHVPPCSEVDPSEHRVLVWTHLVPPAPPALPPPPAYPPPPPIIVMF